MLTLVGFARARLKPVPLSIGFEPDVGAGPAREPVRLGPDAEGEAAGAQPPERSRFPDWDAAGREADRLMRESQGALDASLGATAHGPSQNLVDRLGENTARVAAALKFTRPAPVRFPPLE